MKNLVEFWNEKTEIFEKYVYICGREVKKKLFWEKLDQLLMEK